MTKRLREVAEVVGIQLLDHVVIAANGYISLVAASRQQPRVSADTQATIGTPASRKGPNHVCVFRPS